jgi:hypothetical protein
MSYRNSEDWVHVDDYWKEVDRLEKRVKEMEESIYEQDEEKVRLLAELMLLREKVGGQALEDLTHLIYTHNAHFIKEAENLIMEIEQ